MFDSHAHVAASQFDNDRREVILRTSEAGIAGWIEIGSDVASSKRAIELAEQYQGVKAAVGIHPNNIDQVTEEKWEVLIELLKNKQVVAVGEIGFDYFGGGEYEAQMVAVKRLVGLARRYEKPVVWHIRSGERDAHNDLLEYLSSLSDEERPAGVLHTFSGTVEQARRYLAWGMYFGVSGVVTFKNAGSVIDVVREIPLDKLLIETDCPYLTPEPYRGQRNEPVYVKYMAAKVAEIKGLELKEVEQQTDRNVAQLFGVEISGGEKKKIV